MMANNEIGTIAPISAIGNLCSSRRVLFHTDAVQAASCLPIDVREMDIDLLSVSAHKMYGPKGVGALYIRRSHPQFKVMPQIEGGGHEQGFRSGTLNVPAIVGFGKASMITSETLSFEFKRLTHLRDIFISGLQERIDTMRLNGHRSERLPNNINVTIPGISADTLMMEMSDIACSSGSACSSAHAEPSHVLRAIGLNDEEMRSSIRIGLGRFTTEEEVLYGIHRIGETVDSLRRSHHLAHAKYSSAKVLS
jgi:cysteine desulfurase